MAQQPKQPQPKQPQPKMERYSKTPFARVLIAFMWRQQPPWTSAILAHILGVHRNRPGNWIYHNRVPELNDAIEVMAQLGIPMQALLDAYAEDGLPVPPLTYDDPHSSVQAPANKTTIQQIEQQLVTEEKDERRRAEQARREWELMFVHTRRVMADLGMPASTVEAMLGELQQRRLGAPTPAQRRHAEEMRDVAADSGSGSGSEGEGEDAGDGEDDAGADTTRRHPRRAAPSRPHGAH